MRTPSRDAQSSQFSDDVRLYNLLGATALGLVDAFEQRVRTREELDPRAAQALVALLDFTRSGTVQRLSRVIGLTHSGTVRLVDRLGSLGHVHRDAGDDARSLSVGLTAKGRRVAMRIRDHRRSSCAEPLSSLTASQRRELERTCEVILRSIAAERLAVRSRGDGHGMGALCRLCDFSACQRPEGRCPVARTYSSPRSASSSST